MQYTINKISVHKPKPLFFFSNNKLGNVKENEILFKVATKIRITSNKECPGPV